MPKLSKAFSSSSPYLIIKLSVIPVLLFLVVAGIFFHTTNTIQQQKPMTLLVNMAGRQRMLYQKYVREVLLTSQGIEFDHRTTLRTLMETLNALIRGGSVVVNLTTGETANLPSAPTREILITLEEQKKLFTELSVAAESFLQATPDRQSPEYLRQVKELIDLNTRAYDKSDQAVKLLDQHSQSVFSTLLILENVTLALLSLLGIALGCRIILYVKVNKDLEIKVEESRKLVEELTKKESEWSYAMDFVEDAIYLVGLDDRVLRANRPFYKMTGLSPDQVIGQKITTLLHPEDESTPCPVCQARRDKRDATITMETDNPHNSIGRPIEVMIKMIRDERGKPLNVLMGIHDLSGLEEARKAEEERLRLQSQLIQAQKMESVGRLAGGVAHDFNNLLTGILGYTDLALTHVPDDHPVKEMLDVIKDSSQKASTLTKQLLAFSRKQVLDMKIVSLNAIAEKMATMLKRMIEENIILELRIKTPIRNIMADSAQIEQILMNLVINARDAMPDGGHLIIETSEEILDDNYCRNHHGAEPGTYVMLSVTDTGKGMSPEVQENIFDPFFTTKEMGRGTGLGLSMVYGIVKQHRGHIWVDSEVGKGTSFKIYLPAVQEEVEMKEQNRKEDEEMPGGTETVMVCDDDPSILRLIVYVLKFLGYHLLQASSGEDALKVIHAFAGNIDLLLTDVVMPGMNGKELANAFLAAYPEAKVIFISGYTDEVITRHGILEPGMEFLQKPLTPDILARKVRDVLDKRTY
ncbi:MAG: ATP-binding protein [bacterium]